GGSSGRRGRGRIWVGSWGSRGEEREPGTGNGRSARRVVRRSSLGIVPGGRRVQPEPLKGTEGQCPPSPGRPFVPGSRFPVPGSRSYFTPTNSRPTNISRISFVPAPISYNFASRRIRP